jgi:NAD(P)H dehydrogenase (quinone)
MYVILGITGQVGGATARSLLAAGQSVRAVVRNPAKASAWTTQGTEIVVAELTDSAALQAAFTGVADVFVATPPLLDVADPLGENRRMLAALTTTLLAAGVPKVVYFPSVGAQHDHGLGAIGKLHDLEQAFGQLAIPTAAIRAAWFMENVQGLIGPAERLSAQPAQPARPGHPDGGHHRHRPAGSPHPARNLGRPAGAGVGRPRPSLPHDVTAALSFLLDQPMRTVVVPPTEHRLRTWEGA